MSKRGVSILGPNAAVDVREPVAATDAATWTPSDVAVAQRRLNALDAPEWDEVRITPRFSDGAGGVAVGTSISVQPLVALRDERAGAVDGVQWVTHGSAVALNDGESALVQVGGGFFAFRVTALVLGVAVDATIVAVGTARARSYQL